MKKFVSYPPPPPGMKVIFSQTRRDPRTGRVYRRPPGKPFRMVVPDTSAQPARPSTVLAFKPVPQSQPVKRLTVQPPRPTQLTVVPTPSQSRPHPGAHGDAHDVIGALAGGSRAFRQAPAGQSAGSNFLEALGGALAGAGATRASAAIGQSLPKDHSNITEGLAEKAEAHGAELAQELRKLADAFRQRAAAEAGPNGNGFAEAGFLLLEMLMRIGAGAVNGAPAGARAHLALVNPTEKNIQLLASNI